MPTKRQSKTIPTKQEAIAGIQTAMRFLNIPTDGDYSDTPARYLAAMSEILTPLPFEATKFLTPSGRRAGRLVVAQKGIEFRCVCAHHLFPFWGSADVAYLPSSHVEGRSVLGLSKLSRIVSFWAAWAPQMQERLTAQIADDIIKHADARGVFVVTHAEHGCMKFRGPKQAAVTVVSVAVGQFLTDDGLMAEAKRLLSQ